MPVILRLLFIDMSQCARSEETPLQSHASDPTSTLYWHVTVTARSEETPLRSQWSYVYSLLTCHSVPDLKKHHYSHMPEWSYVYSRNHIDGVMVSVLPSSAVDHVFEPRSGQTKEYKIGICCLSTKHAALWKKSKDQG
jgi:hypothetical protein